MFSYVEEQEVGGCRMNLNVHFFIFIIGSQLLLSEPEIFSSKNNITSLGFHEHLKLNLERYFRICYFFGEETIIKTSIIHLVSIHLFSFKLK